MRRFLRPLAAGVVGLTLVVGAACSDSSGPSTAADETRPPASEPTQVPDSTGTTASGASTRQPGELTASEIVKKAEPSIVRIQTNSGVGTGFVVDPDGYIMTNEHVVQGNTGRTATNIRVTLSDGDEVPAQVIGTDARTDMALLKIEKSGLPALAFADLESVEIGQDVVAIGYALNLSFGEGPSFTVTRGIVSQKNRAINENSPGRILGAIQTDAAINHGNSGGPLLNMWGEVVGINTALAPDGSGGLASGIGFAVGSDVAQAVYDALRENGRVERGLLGVRDFEALRPARARELGLPDDTAGVWLGFVEPSNPAGQAGLVPGNVITRIGDVEVRNETDLVVALIKHGAGETVEVEYYNGTEKVTTQVTLAAA